MTGQARIDPEQVATEMYALLRVCEKMYEMSARDGYLHPATMTELTYQYTRACTVASMRWTQKQAEEEGQ